MFQPSPKSRVKLDIMPYIVSDKNHPDKIDEESIAVAGELWYKRPFKVYRNIGVDGDTVVSPLSIGKPCPIADYRARRQKEGAPKDELADLRPKLRNLYVVIPIGVKDLEEKPHIWDVSQYLFQELLDEELEEDEDYGVFPDLEDGLTLKIRFDEGKFGANKFAETSRIDFLSRKKGYDESILDDIPDLDEILDIPTYEELERKFLELDDEDIADQEADWDDDEDDEEEETSKRSKKSSKKKSKPEPEEDEEDWEDDDDDDDDWEDDEEDLDDDESDEEEDDEDDEDDDDWDDDDEEDEDEEEEEEKPAQKRTKKPTKSSKKQTRRKKK